MEPHLYYTVNIYPPASVKKDPNVTLHLDVEKVSMEDLSSGEDKLSVDSSIVKTPHMSFNFSPPTGKYGGRYSIILNRDVLLADVRKQKLDLMPGFRISWRYSGMEVESEVKYHNKAFVR